MMFATACVFFLPLFLLAVSNEFPGEDDEDNRFEIVKNISAAVFQMFNKGFVEEQSQRQFNFYAQATGPERMIFFKDVISEFLQTKDDTIGVRLAYDEHLPADNGRHYSVLLVDSVESLEFLYTEYQVTHEHILGYYIVVLYTFEEHYYDELIKVFALSWDVGVLYTNVIVHALANLLLSFEAFPYSEFHCKGMSPTIHNKFIDSHWQHQDFFPEKLVNLHGCPVICATWQDLPFLAVKYDNNSIKPNILGIEGQLLELLAAKLNFTLVFRWMTDKEISQTLDDKAEVFEKNDTDLIAGAFNYKPTNPLDHYAPTVAYYLSNYYLIIGSSTEPYSPLVKLLFPFGYEIWSILLIIMVLALLVVRFLKASSGHFVFGRRNHTPIYNMFVVSLGGNLATFPGRNFARFLLYNWLLLTMVLRCAYQGYMYHFIRNDIEKPLPATIQKALDQGYVIYLTPFVRDSLQNLPYLRDHAQLLNGSEIENFLMLQHEGNKKAILTAYGYFGYFKRTHTHNAVFHVVKETVFTQQLSFYMRKNSVLLWRFNCQIMQYISAGLMTKSVVDLIDSKLATDAEMGIEQQQVFQFHHILGAVYVLLFGYLLASFVLLLEIILEKVKQ